MVTPPESFSELVAQLGDALAEERQALLSGKPEQIAAASQKKAALADRIEAATAVPGAPRPSAEVARRRWRATTRRTGSSATRCCGT